MPEDKTVSSKSFSFSVVVYLICQLCWFGSIFLTIAGWLGKYHWGLDVLVHVTPQVLVIQLLLLGFFIAWKEWKLLIPGVVCLLWNAYLVVPYYLPQPTAPVLAQVKLLQLNVLTANQNYQKTIQYIEAKSPDLIALQESDQKWVNQLAPVMEKYPHKLVTPREDNFGIALLSRLPMESSQSVVFTPAGLPSIVADVVFPQDARVSVLVPHPLPPIERGFKQRNLQFAQIAFSRNKFGKNLLVVGDLNVTPWSVYFRELLSDLALRDSQLGFGVQPSWPTVKGALLERVAIDHVLVSDNFVVLKRELGPNVGSDHLPVYVELGLKK